MFTSNKQDVGATKLTQSAGGMHQQMRDPPRDYTQLITSTNSPLNCFLTTLQSTRITEGVYGD